MPYFHGFRLRFHSDRCFHPPLAAAAMRASSFVLFAAATLLVLHVIAPVSAIQFFIKQGEETCLRSATAAADSSRNAIEQKQRNITDDCEQLRHTDTKPDQTIADAADTGICHVGRLQHSTAERSARGSESSAHSRLLLWIRCIAV